MRTEIIILILLILLNGLFSMAELAVVSARRVRLQTHAKDGHKGARAALDLVDNPTRFLSTVQIGITLIGILSGALGGATIAENLSLFFNQYPALTSYSEALGVGIVVIIVTFFSLVIGELVPKRLALGNPERIASGVAPLMVLAYKITTPIVNLLSFSTEFTLRLLGIKSVDEPAVTEEEIKILIDQGRKSGVFEDVEQKIVERVFRMSDRTVNSIMTYRAEIVWLDVDDPFEVSIDKVIESGHTNFVLSQGDLDNIVGIVRAKDLLAECAGGDPVSVRTSPQLPPLFPKGMNALDAVERMREERSPLALILDEFGSIIGLVTLTDVLEAIIGEMPGMDVNDGPEATQREDGSWLVDGIMSVDELQLLLEMDVLPEQDTDYETVSGMLMVYLGRIPHVGDTFEWRNLRFEVMDLDGFRVDKVLVTPLLSKKSPGR